MPHLLCVLAGHMRSSWVVQCMLCLLELFKVSHCGDIVFYHHWSLAHPRQRDEVVVLVMTLSHVTCARRGR